jgi:hypothetical protein
VQSASKIYVDINYLGHQCGLERQKSRGAVLSGALIAKLFHL